MEKNGGGKRDGGVLRKKKKKSRKPRFREFDQFLIVQGGKERKEKGVLIPTHRKEGGVGVAQATTIKGRLVFESTS